jgi:hypothetical protein
MSIDGPMSVAFFYEQFCKQLRGNEFHIYDSHGFSITKHQRTALYVSVDVGASHYGYEKDGNTEHEYGARHYRKLVHFLITGNVHVWTVKADFTGFPLSKIKPEDWENVSNHDTCWRTDGIHNALVDAYFESTTYVQEHLPEEMRDAPKDVSTFSHIDRVELKEIVYESIPDTRKAREYRILSIENSERNFGIS